MWPAHPLSPQLPPVKEEQCQVQITQEARGQGALRSGKGTWKKGNLPNLPCHWPGRKNPAQTPAPPCPFPGDQTPQQDGRGTRPLLGHFWGQEPTTPKALCSSCRNLELLEASDPESHPSQRTPHGAGGQTPSSFPEHSHHAPWLPTAFSGPNISLPSILPLGMKRIMNKMKIISVTNI